MTDGTDPTNARCDERHLEIWTSFAEFFKSAEFIDVQIGVLHRAIVLDVDGNLGMSFNTGNWFDRNFLRHVYS